MDSQEIRKKYLDFFVRRGHTAVPSDSLIPSGDPTLLFTSAGMVQFKKHFLGQSKDAFTRAASCQKCFRTSDIEQVGFTNRHLTFFEMLGNFSFGDYFKKDAIAWGWEFLTRTMALPAENLHITIYKDDDEAFDLWRAIVPAPRITRMGENTNFWNMGPTGPCGPSSEILYDLGPEMSCGRPDCGPACSCDRYLEVWNLVFTQFDRQPDGELKPLPRKNIDTGMGLERLVAVVNGKNNVFDTDLFAPLMSSIADILDAKPAGHVPALRMMADHCRAITFLISDGILPSNEGRGYVLRRLLRRALRQGKILGRHEPFLYRITGDVVRMMSEAYPELKERRENIAAITKMEEAKFLETIEAGTRLLEELIDRHRGPDAAKGGGAMKATFVIPGNEAFKLYDTYGFPLDLTREIAREKGLAIDEEGFLEAQKRAQEKSRAAWSGSGEKDTTFYAKLLQRHGDTVFKGYEALFVKTTVAAIVRNGAEAQYLAEGEEGEVILGETPFYAESGGQAADTGKISIPEKMRADVTTVLKPAGNLFLHKVKVARGELRVGQTVDAAVDEPRRRNIMRHHTATHLLHKALRAVLGTHVTQAGSLVTPDYFRFDFTHPAAMKLEELAAAESMVNAAIRANMEVCVAEMPIEEARKAGAMALFGEKYGATVRTVAVRESCDAEPFSMELCGGTHARRTGDIGMFKIVAESSVAAGTRRIEAVAGESAERYVRGLENILNDAAAALKASRTDLAGRIERLLQQQKDAEREMSKLKSQLASGGVSDLVKNVRDVGGIKLLAGKVAGADAAALRDLADAFRAKLGSGIVVLASTEEEKFSFIVTVTPDLVKAGRHAGKIAKSFAALVAGSGGGKPDFAQGGGKDVAGLDAALEKLPGIIVE